MNTIYGDISTDSFCDNLDDLIGQIFKLLPYKESSDDRLDYHITTLLFRISGMSRIFSNIPELITIMSLLEAARTETDFHLFRKAVLDSCSMMKKVQDKINGSLQEKT